MHLLNALKIMLKLEKDIGNNANVSLHVVDDNLGIQVDFGNDIRFRRLFSYIDLGSVSEEIMILFLIREIRDIYEQHMKELMEKNAKL